MLISHLRSGLEGCQTISNPPFMVQYQIEICLFMKQDLKIARRTKGAKEGYISKPISYVEFFFKKRKTI